MTCTIHKKVFTMDTELKETLCNELTQLEDSVNVKDQLENSEQMEVLEECEAVKHITEVDTLENPGPPILSPITNNIENEFLSVVQNNCDYISDTDCRVLDYDCVRQLTNANTDLINEEKDVQKVLTSETFQEPSCTDSISEDINVVESSEPPVTFQEPSCTDSISEDIDVVESSEPSVTVQEPLCTDSVDEGTDVVQESLSSETFHRPSLDFNNLQMLTGAWKEFVPKKEKIVFLKGCKWSPDGTCLLTNSDDATMRLFDLPLELYNCHSLSRTSFPELTPSLRTKIGGLVYDYGWYPLMTSNNPDTCCFITTSFCAPVQLWDAFSGTLRCSYKGFNAQDELHAALSVTFDPIGDLVLCGYKDSIKIFHTDVPGRDYTTISTKAICEQRGIVSCIAVNPSMPNIFSAGTYSKSVGLYSVDGHGICLLQGQTGGLTQIMFSQDGSRLFAAGRKDSEILCWDLRQLGRVLYALQRPHTTNQRVYMDLSSDDKFLLSGSSDGQVRVWDLQVGFEEPAGLGNSILEPMTLWRAHNDCVNGLSIHRHIPVVATASGQRYVPELVADDNDAEDDKVFVTKRPRDQYEDSIKLWWCGDVAAS